MKKLSILIVLMSSTIFAQSDVEKILKGGEVILGGLSFLKPSKTAGTDSKFIESVCVKNKLPSTITFKMTGKDSEENDIRKELVIPKDGKECLLELPKGIYAYEIILPTKEIYKKGEYRFDDAITITVKAE